MEKGITQQIPKKFKNTVFRRSRKKLKFGSCRFNGVARTNPTDKQIHTHIQPNIVEPHSFFLLFLRAVSA